jgi:hypothetical protein
VNGTGAQLDLLRRAVLEQLPRFDLLLQRRVESQQAVDTKDVGDEVVGEGGEPISVVQLGDPHTVNVGGRDLGALEEGDRAALVEGSVSKCVPGGQQAGEFRG